MKGDFMSLALVETRRMFLIQNICPNFIYLNISKNKCQDKKLGNYTDL